MTLCTRDVNSQKESSDKVKVFEFYVVTLPPCRVTMFFPFRCGDILLAVNGRCTSGMTYTHLVRMLKELKGRVVLTIVSWPGSFLQATRRYLFYIPQYFSCVLTANISLLNTCICPSVLGINGYQCYHACQKTSSLNSDIKHFYTNLMWNITAQMLSGLFCLAELSVFLVPVLTLFKLSVLCITLP